MVLKEWPKDDVKATLQLYFALTSCIVVVMMVTRGILQPSHLYYVAVGIPAALLGAGTGIRLYNRIDQVFFGRVLVFGMLIGGLSYIAHAGTALLAEVGR